MGAGGIGAHMTEERDIEGLVGETVLVRMMNGNQYAGELVSYEEDFSLTLGENGGPEPDDDDFTFGDATYENIEGESILNGENVELVELFD